MVVKIDGNGKAIRFAVLVRVSTERQEHQGESLTVQRMSNTRDVERVGGVIVEWYGGQEHATEGWERKEVDRLLADAAKHKFDAVMVAYADRWSRDNLKSETGLETFRQHGVRFFVGAVEKNLFDPSAKFELGIQALVGAFVAEQQAKKSIETRIYRARTKGKPTCGPQRPFGRVWEDETGWSVDQQAQALITDVAERFLAGEGLAKLAMEKGMSYSNLWKVLRYRCGDAWEQVFSDKKLNIHETVITTVPRLLEESVIRDVRARLDAGRSWMRALAQPHIDYLLSGCIFCEGCGYSMVGDCDKQTGHLYYRHARPRARSLSRKCPIRPIPRVRAKWIEDRVIGKLFDMFGSPAQIERAVRSAVPDCDRLLKRREEMQAEAEKVSKSRERVIGLVVSGHIEDEEAKGQLARLKEKKDHLSKEIDQLDGQLRNLPTQEGLRLYLERIGDAIFLVDQHGDLPDSADGCAYYPGGNDVGTYLTMTRADKRHLVTAVFGQRLADGRPAGVYIYPDDSVLKGGRQRTWNFTLRGLLEFEQVVQSNSSGPSSRSASNGRSKRNDLGTQSSPPARGGRPGR